jgi:hypothetical protein
MSETPRIKLSDEVSVDVIDPDNITPVFANLVTELSVVDGVLYLSLANLIVEGNDPLIRKAQVCARLRIAGGTAQYIQRMLTAPQQTESPVPEGQTIQ